MDKVPFRQIHLDFHTSGLIDNIGSDFDKEEFKRTLALGHVNSITLFAKGHHGYSFYPSEINEMHPGLDFNLLGQQLEACKEAGVRAPVYISAGFDEKEAVLHPEWLCKNAPNASSDFLTGAGYHLFCFNTPYLDKLISHTEEVMRLFNPTEVFLDICDERICYCNKCLRDMREAGLDPHDTADVREWAKRVYANYCKRVEKAVRKYNSDTVIFHNAGNIPMGRRDMAGYDDHLELESLPTGGWGYDHFPMSAAYCRNLGKEYIGMTGKFHTTWGEFGGFKHPNALIYETSLSIALGAKCSVGDQLHPSGKLNEATYSLIGKAYSLVEKKEPWCNDVKAISDIGVLSAASTKEREGKNSISDVGANRILLEKKYLYDFIDRYCDFGSYKLLLLPDEVYCDGELKAKLREYVSKGGKVLFSGKSAKDVFDGITVGDKREFKPDYMQPVSDEGFVNGITQYVMYEQGYSFNCEGFETVAYMAEPYFNRAPEHFSSHQHTPDKPGELKSAAVINGSMGYISWEIFKDYATKGELHCKELVDNMISQLLGNGRTLTVKNLPDRGVITLMNQQKENRLVNHILYAHTSVRGKNIEVIEDCVPIYNVDVKIKCHAVKSVKTVPDGKEIDYTYENGILSYTVPEVNIHTMVEIAY